MIRVSVVFLLALGALTALPATARPVGPPLVIHAAKARDLDQIRASKVLRVLVNQSRNSSGEVQGQAIGVEYRRLAALESYLNRQPTSGKSAKIHLKLIPRSKEQLFGALQRGEGDLVAPGELMNNVPPQGVVASDALLGHTPLILVGRQGGRRYSHVEQLSGRTVALTSGSAAGAAIDAINQKLIQRRLRPINVEWVDPTLAVEDVLEMVQGGIFGLTVVEQPIAERWGRVMPKLSLDRKVAFNTPQTMSWYVRNDAPALRENIDQFIRGYKAPTDQDVAFKRVYGGLYQVHYPLDRSDRQHLEQLRPLLQRNAREQHMDWLDLAAVAFKESDLNPAAHGGNGATGLLQITPSAARQVGVSDVHTVDSNVQAGARYLAMIRKKFFASNRLNERERMAFTLAAYNMGPERVEAMRAEAKRRGLNPNQWFFQVERIAMEQMGMSAVSYVNSVNKYYLAFDRERDTLEPGGRKVASLR